MEGSLMALGPSVRAWPLSRRAGDTRTARCRPPHLGTSACLAGAGSIDDAGVTSSRVVASVLALSATRWKPSRLWRKSAQKAQRPGQEGGAVTVDLEGSSRRGNAGTSGAGGGGGGSSSSSSSSRGNTGTNSSGGSSSSSSGTSSSADGIFEGEIEGNRTFTPISWPRKPPKQKRVVGPPAPADQKYVEPLEDQILRASQLELALSKDKLRVSVGQEWADESDEDAGLDNYRKLLQWGRTGRVEAVAADDIEGDDKDGDIEDEDKDGDEGSIMKRPSAAIIQRLPDDEYWDSLEEKGFPGPSDIVVARRGELPNAAFGDFPDYEAERKLGKRIQEEKQKEIDAILAKRPFPLATKEEKDEIARVSTAEARAKAREINLKRETEHKISDEIGTGPASPSVYVEIPPRPGPEFNMPQDQTVNQLISDNLGIPYEKAARLVRMGCAWYWDTEEEVHRWARLVANQRVEFDVFLRVFPNPERFRTCYVEDWEDRVMSTDRDYVVIDKPPLLPCLPSVANGRESLAQCAKEGLRVKIGWGGLNNQIKEDFTPCSQVDEEATGLVVLSRHPKAVEKFDEWHSNGEVTFEFVALTERVVDVGFYRAFYKKTQEEAGLPKPPLYAEIPTKAINNRMDYTEWETVSMEVVSNAELPGGKGALRIRTWKTGFRERVRAQLALLGAPVLNDHAHVKTHEDAVGEKLGYLPHTPDVPEQGLALASPMRRPFAGAVADEVLHGPYGRKLEMVESARKASSQGSSQEPRKKTPVALHLSRIEFGGRMVTCAPPKWWPEGAAATVATILTAKDKKELVLGKLLQCGGWCRFGILGGSYGVNVDWLEEHFMVDRVAGVAFASEDARKEWESKVRVKQGKKVWEERTWERHKKRKELKFKLRTKFLKPSEWGTEKAGKNLPTWRMIKKGQVKPINDRY